MKLIIASRNVHKIREIRAMLKPLGALDLYSLIDYPDYTPPPETGVTFEENATIKATDAAKSLNAYVIADDSGLVVPILNGHPGVRSARYAGEEASDRDNRKKLLEALSSHREEDRDAYYECCMVLASPEKIEKCVSARCEGRILESERGGQGFGYDSLFLKHEYNKTFAELEEEVKNRVSHRRKALDKLLVTLESIAQELAESQG